MSWNTVRRLLKGTLVWTVVVLLSLDSAMACRLFGRRAKRRSQCCAPPCCEVVSEPKSGAAGETKNSEPPSPSDTEEKPVVPKNTVDANAAEKPAVEEKPEPAKPEATAERGFQLVYGSTANLFVDRHKNYIGYGPEASELVGIPDPDTFVQLPWDKRVARVFCTCFRNREEKVNPGISGILMSLRAWSSSG